jgi:hypothetical protein
MTALYAMYLARPSLWLRPLSSGDDHCLYLPQESFPAGARRSDGHSNWCRSSLWRSGQAAEGLTIPSEALFQDHDPLEPTLPFAHEQRAGLQTQALAGLRPAALERSADALFPRAKNPSDRFVDIAERIGLERYAALSSRASVNEGRALRHPNGRAIDGANPLRSRPSRLATINRREASSGSEAPGVVAICRFPARPEFARAWVMPTTPHLRFSLGPAAVDRGALQYGPISAVSRGVRDPVD